MWIPLLVALIGLALYFVPVPTKVSEIGRILFFVGMFFVVWALLHTAAVITVRP
jgi:Na+/phosphate symporter